VGQIENLIEKGTAMTTEERLAKKERELAVTRKELADLRAELDNE